MIRIRSRAEWDRWADFTLRNGFPLAVEAKPWKPTRTNEANAYLWGVCYALLSERTGYSPEELHEYCCGQHFGWSERKTPRTPLNPSGLVNVPRRTTTRDEEGSRATLNKAEFSAFVETVHRIAAQAGVFIPDAQAA